MNIAYITERDLNSNQISGAITRDIRLLEVLNSFSKVDVYFNDPTKYHKYLYLINNKKTNKKLFDEIDSKKYDIVIISTFAISPFLEGYNKIRNKKIFYFADSSFHMKNQYLSIKYKIITTILTMKEKKILKENYCAYLGKDEIKYIPNKYKEKCLIFPFYIKTNDNLFKDDGGLIVVGDYSFKPNYLMLKNINSIAEKINNIIYVYGKNIPQLEYKKNIKIAGYAKTLKEIYKDKKALLYPINYGTGIKNKVLEAMSYGIPTIGFKEAFTNLDLIDNETCLIVSDLNQLALECSNKSLSDISKLLYKKSNKDFSFSKIKNLVFQEIYRVVNE